MIKYQRNNILFRIASADAIGKFKGTQAHSFVQLTRKELDFDESAKEVVLLEYDRFSQWVFRIERICLAAGEGVMELAFLQSIISSFDDEIKVIEGVIESHREVFSLLVIDFTKLIHKYSVPMICAKINEKIGISIDTAYVEIVEVLSNYLQHLLISLHEFNSNMVKHTPEPFLSISEFSAAIANPDERFLGCGKRAKFFVDNNKGTTYVLKNYSKCEVFDDAKKYLANLHITVIPENIITSFAE